MEMEPSQPILESYVGGDGFHDDEATSGSDDELVEEDMASHGQQWMWLEWHSRSGCG